MNGRGGNSPRCILRRPSLAGQQCRILTPLLLFVAVISHVAHSARADVGDVSFHITGTNVSVPAGATDAVPASVDVLLELEGGGSIPAAGWAAIFEITPAAGATGSIAFNPPPIINSEPNLPVASENPFADFDRDFGGKTYGELGDSPFELHAVAAYVPPTSAPPPPLDASGNLALPHGAGLASLPLLVSPFASGDFIISVADNPQTASVLALTGNSPPNDMMIHAVGAHVAGLVTVQSQFSLTGDYNRDGSVDAADYILWRKNDGTLAGFGAWRTNFGRSAQIPGDFNADGSVNAADYVLWRKDDGSPAGYNLWRANFGRTAQIGPAAGAHAAIPEPATLLMAMAAMLAAGIGLRLRSARHDWQKPIRG